MSMHQTKNRAELFYSIIELFKRLKTFINIHGLHQSRVILCRDFNCNINNTTNRRAKILKDCIQILNVKELWLDKHKISKGFTWCDTPESRIDFVFINNYLLNAYYS